MSINLSQNTWIQLTRCWQRISKTISVSHQNQSLTEDVKLMNRILSNVDNLQTKVETISLNGLNNLINEIDNENKESNVDPLFINQYFEICDKLKYCFSTSTQNKLINICQNNAQLANYESVIRQKYVKLRNYWKQ